MKVLDPKIRFNKDIETKNTFYHNYIKKIKTQVEFI